MSAWQTPCPFPVRPPPNGLHSTQLRCGRSLRKRCCPFRHPAPLPSQSAWLPDRWAANRDDKHPPKHSPHTQRLPLSHKTSPGQQVRHDRGRGVGGEGEPANRLIPNSAAHRSERCDDRTSPAAHQRVGNNPAPCQGLVRRGDHPPGVLHQRPASRSHATCPHAREVVAPWGRDSHSRRAPIGSPPDLPSPNVRREVSPGDGRPTSSPSPPWPASPNVRRATTDS